MASLSKGPLGQQHGAAVEKVPVESSWIMFAEYDISSLRLTITFKNGSVRNYAYVEPQSWNDFKLAPSKGRAFNSLIKGKSPSVPILDKRVGRKTNGPVSKTSRRKNQTF